MLSLFKTYSMEIKDGCSDSLVPESLITDSSPGQIYVHRNIAGQFPQGDPNSLAVLYHAIVNLGIPNVAVVGHTRCTGVAKSLANSKIVLVDPTPADQWLGPLTERAKQSDIAGITDENEALSQLLQANLQLQVDNIRNAAEAFSTQLSSAGVPITGYHQLMYDVDTGILTDVTPPE